MEGASANHRMLPKLRIVVVTLLLTLPIDQVAKLRVVRALGVGEEVPLIGSWFVIVHARNPGAAFGLFADWDTGWRVLVFVLVTVVAAGIIYSFYRGLAPGDRANALALGFVLAGVLGNLVDRIFRGAVIDFMRIQLTPETSWPDFNFADVFILLGVAALIVELLANESAARASALAATEDDEV